MMTPLSYLYNGDFQGFFLRLLFILPAIVVAMSFHEAAHAWMADKMGDPTGRNMGRMTLDPTKHFDLFGFISFVFLGFGWGKPVQTNPRNYYNYKKANVLVALSGVTVNLLLALLTLVLISVLTLLGVFKAMIPLYLLDKTYPLTMAAIIHILLFYIASLNLSLCFFNLIPIPPLDGHHLIKGFIARKSPNFYMMYQQYGFFFLLLIFFATPLGDYLGELVLLIIEGVAALFGIPIVG